MNGPATRISDSGNALKYLISELVGRRARLRPEDGIKMDLKGF
jgi:hypothetical protein